MFWIEGQVQRVFFNTSVVKTKSSKCYGVYNKYSKNCISFAVVEIQSNKENFFNWYKVNKQSPAHILVLSQMDLPEGRGTKRTKSTQVQK